MVIFKGVNFYPSQIERILLRQPGLEHEYQIVLERDAARGDRLILCVEAGRSSTGSPRPGSCASWVTV